MSNQPSLPEVAVPEFPERPEQMVRWFYEMVVEQYFPRARITTEDRAKVEQYAAQARRSDLAANLDRESFIRSLEIRLTFAENALERIERTSQPNRTSAMMNWTLSNAFSALGR